jgi:guanylate kinase
LSKKGKMFIVAAPSGAGKTSLVNAMVKEMTDVQISVSYTTRRPREGERDGVDYHFIQENLFEQMVIDQAFLEYATVFGRHYGTGRQWVLDKLHQGIDIILEIDWQGARQLRELFSQVVSIFILPPSMEELAQRLIKRQQDEQDIIEERMAKAHAEMVHYNEFDYLIINRDFSTAKEQLKHIILAERLKLRDQQHAEAGLIAQLLQKP